MALAFQSWPVTLTSGGVTLRPLRYRDKWEWDDVRVRNHDWTGPWDATQPRVGSGHPFTFNEMVRSHNKAARDGRSLPWVITYDPTGREAGPIVGQLTVSGITRGAAQWGQAGYWVDHTFAGLGIVPVSLAMAADHCFDVLHLHRFEVAIRPENTNSLRVVEKLGFRYEGRRPRYLHVAGDWRDHDMFVLHSDEVEGSLVDRLHQHP